MRSSQIRLLCLLASIAAVCSSPVLAHERPSTTPAARFLQGAIERAFDLVRPPVSARSAAQLENLLRNAMDWPNLTQFAIGRYGAELDEGGMVDARTRLERQLGALALRAGRELPAMTLAIHDMRIDPDGTRHVLSTANLPRFGEIEVEWILTPTRTDTSYRIADIKALGLTLRQFLRSWIANLVAARNGDAAAAVSDAPATSPQ